MAASCEVCGRGTVFGRNIRHKHTGRWERKAPKTNRTFKMNLHVRQALIQGVMRKARLCTRCMRTQLKSA